MFKNVDAFFFLDSTENGEIIFLFGLNNVFVFSCRIVFFNFKISGKWTTSGNFQSKKLNILGFLQYFDIIFYWKFLGFSGGIEAAKCKFYFVYSFWNVKKRNKIFLLEIISHVFPHVLFYVKTLTHFAIKLKNNKKKNSSVQLKFNELLFFIFFFGLFLLLFWFLIYILTGTSKKIRLDRAGAWTNLWRIGKSFFLHNLKFVAFNDLEIFF